MSSRVKKLTHVAPCTTYLIFFKTAITNQQNVTNQGGLYDIIRAVLRVVNPSILTWFSIFIILSFHRESTPIERSRTPYSELKLTLVINNIILSPTTTPNFIRPKVHLGHSQENKVNIKAMSWSWAQTSTLWLGGLEKVCMKRGNSKWITYLEQEVKMTNSRKCRRF